MGFVMAAFVAAVVVIAALWVLSLQKSADADRSQTQRQEAEDMARRREAQREAELRQAGVVLHCMGCGAQFPGPLPDEGCPQCHIHSLVVTEAEYLRTQQEA